MTTQAGVGTSNAETPERATGAGSITAGGTGTTASLASRVKQPTPSRIPMPNPDIMLRNVPFPELAEACSNFAYDNLLGRGGFGEVYIGKWNGQQIAVKRIREERRR